MNNLSKFLCMTALGFATLNAADFDEDDFDLQQAMLLSIEANQAVQPAIVNQPAPLPAVEDDGDELQEALQLSLAENDEADLLAAAQALSLQTHQVVENDIIGDDDNDEEVDKAIALTAHEFDEHNDEELDAVLAASLAEYDEWDYNWRAGNGDTPAMVGLVDRIEEEQRQRRAKYYKNQD